MEIRIEAEGRGRTACGHVVSAATCSSTLTATLQDAPGPDIQVLCWHNRSRARHQPAARWKAMILKDVVLALIFGLLE
jgi:hypothetical protein